MYQMNHEYLMIVQSVAQETTDQLVRIPVPFSNFAIEDLDGNAVEFDNVRPT
jgi:hypothetical protein